MREKLKNDTGITSMTLVMAIIILLILIGLAMAFLGNDKGEETTNTAGQEENEVLDNFENIISTNQENELEPSDIYVTLYDGGTLAFSNNSNTIEGKTVLKNFGNIKEQKYKMDWTAQTVDTPWFSYAPSITTIDIVNEIVPTDMTGWFAGFNQLTQINNIQNIKTGNVTNMEALLYNCTKLTNIDLSSFDTKNVTNMNAMFATDSEQGMALQEIKGVQNFNTSKVTNLSAMFLNCKNLKGLENVQYDTKNVINMSEMFNGCTQMKQINPGLVIGEKVTDVTNIFANSGITSLPENFEMGNNVVSAKGMFENTNIKDIPIEFTLANATKLEDSSYMFSGCTSLESLPSNFTLPTSVKNCSSMFNLCEKLASIPNTFNLGTNVEQCNNMFYNCKSLAQIPSNFTIPNKVTDISGIFKGCKNLYFDNLIIPTGVTNITEAFSEIEELKGNITIQASPTEYQMVFKDTNKNAEQITIKYTETCTNIQDIISTIQNEKIEFSQI